MLEAMTASATFGDVLRDWRRRRRLSQLDLALEADVSARHVSFVENGRSKPSRAMVLRLRPELPVMMVTARLVMHQRGRVAPVNGDGRLVGRHRGGGGGASGERGEAVGLRGGPAVHHVIVTVGDERTCGPMRRSARTSE